MLPTTRLPSFADIQDASRRLAGSVIRTPILSSPELDEATGAQVFLKAEHLQRTGSFKFRGAFNAVARLTDEARANGVVTFSAGNHGQALALAASRFGVPAVVVMPQDAPSVKIENTRRLGAEIVLFNRATDDREALVRDIAHRRGMSVIPPFDHADVIAGQGTAALELLQEAGPLDLLVAPLGGGGLLAGCALVAEAQQPDCRVLGVEPEGADDGRQSLQAGRVVTIAPPATIADGARSPHIGALNFAVIQHRVSDILVVGDSALLAEMHFAATVLRQVLEPTACLGLAALRQSSSLWRGKRVGVFLTGGNVEMSMLVKAVS